MKQRQTNPANLTLLAQQIRNEILKDVHDARLRELGAAIISKYNVPARSPEQLARAFQLFAQEEIKFFREYPEINAAPWITAKWKIGDCDDKARLIAALLKSFRIPVRLTFMTFKVPEGIKSHVWPEFLSAKNANDKNWIALESVQPWPMGKSPEDVIKSKGYPYKMFSVII